MACDHSRPFRFGWFWECPNGDQCQYRHALPPGFVLKSQRKAAEEAARGQVISIEEFLEVEVGWTLLLLQFSPFHIGFSAT